MEAARRRRRRVGPEDAIDEAVVGMLDSGIGLAFIAIGLVSVEDEGRRGFTINYADRSDQVREFRRLANQMANMYYQLARSLTDNVEPPDLPDDMHGAMPCMIALVEEDAVINEGMSLAELDTNLFDAIGPSVARS
jgi:hypothetical protein